MERDQCWSDRDRCSWLEFVFECLIEELPTGFTVAHLHLWFCWFGLVQNENTPITKSERSRARIPSMRQPASTEITTASVECVKQKSVFLHIQLLGTNV